MSDTTLDVTITDNSGESRYEVHLAGALAGFVDYQAGEGLIDFLHTEVFEEFGGKGLAQELARQSLDDVRARGLRALPHCAFYAKYIAKNPEYLDLVPEDRRAKFNLA